MKAKLTALGLFLMCLCQWPVFAQAPAFQQLFDEHGAVMLLINPVSGEIVDANPAAAKFYGYPRAELKTKTIQQINTLSEDQVAAERALAAREGRNYFIFRHELASGEIRTVEVYSNPFTFEGRRLLWSMIHDITPGRNIDQGMWHYQQRLEELVAQRTGELEGRNRWLLAALLLSALIASALIAVHLRRKRAEAALAYRQGVFSALFEQSGFLAGVLDRDGRLREVNQRALQLIGQSAAAVIGRAFVDTPWWQEEDKPRLREALVCAAAGQSASFEATHVGKDGHALSVLFHALPVTIEGRHYISVIGVDITEMKQLAAMEMRHQRLFGAVFDQAAIGLALVSPSGRFLNVNQQFASMLGYSREEMLAPGFDTHAVTHPDDLTADLELIRQLLDGQADHYAQEKRYFHRDGHVIWAELNVRLVRNEAGQPDFFISSVGDMTERKAAEVSPSKAKQAAEAANIAKSRFLATMSHEIRTPMNGILGMAQLLMGTAMSEAERRNCTRTIFNSGQTLLTLLNDILDLSKVEAGKLSLAMAVVDPQQILHEILALFSDGANAKGLSLDVTWTGPDFSRYRSDPHRLRQMLSNLVNNAVKFTSQGQVHLSAVERVDVNGEVLLEFSVADTGIGIPLEQQTRLFEPFSQADSSTTRQFGGTGLGLSIVRSLARLMGGDAGLESQPGQGSRFWFRVRAERVDPHENTRQLARPHTTADMEESYPQMRGRVLVVEDNPANQLVLNTLLPKLGLQSVLAENGQEAVDCMVTRGEPIDAILMDLQMPIMDGYEATQRIRAWERESAAHATNVRPPIPIIALTADVFPDDREHCQRIGMNDFLAKPIMIEDLLETLSRFLGSTPAPTKLQPNPQPTTRTLDRPRFIELANALLPMLQQRKFAAVDCFAELERLALDTPQAPALSEIRQSLDAFRFTEALAALTTLINQLAVQEPLP